LSSETSKPEHCVALPEAKKSYPLNTSQATSRPMIAPTMLRLKTNLIGGTLTAWRASVGESLVLPALDPSMLEAARSRAKHDNH
jgi:hypothetical protein